MHADAALIVYTVQQLDQPDLAGIAHVRRTAGASVAQQVAVPDLHDAHILGQREFGAVLQGGKLLRGRIECQHRQAGADVTVYGILDPVQLFPRQDTVKIQRHVLIAQMKAHVVKAVLRIHSAGHEMLPRMALHPFQADSRVHLPAHNCAGGQRGRQCMADHAVCAHLHIPDKYPAQRAAVGILTAALRKEGGFIQYHGVLPSRQRLAGKDGRVKYKQMAVCVKQTCGGSHRWLLSFNA